MKKNFALLLLLFFATACAPRLQAIGPEEMRPSLTETAIHTADGIDLPLRRFWPQGKPRAMILALHGFNDYSKGFSEPAKKFAEAGIALYAYDQRGFGAAPQRGIWAGEEHLIKDLNVAARLIKQEHPDLPLFLLGESMGGAVVILAATGGDPPPADGLILSAPALWSWDNLTPFSRWMLRESAHVIPWVTVRPTGLRLRASSNDRALYDLYRDRLVIKDTRIDNAYFLVDLMSHAQKAIEKLYAPRYLVLYGKQEAVLPTSSVQEALRLLPSLPSAQRRVAFYPDGYHLLLRDLNADIVIKDIVEWIDHPERTLLSGAENDAPFPKNNGNTTAEDQAPAQ